MESGIEQTALLVPSYWIVVAAIVLLLLLSAFFSGSETALTAANRGKLHGLADKGSKGAGLALRLTEDSERLIGSVLLGNNLVNILAASLATSLFTKIFGDSGVAMATLVMTVLVLVFAEVMPKTYAITNPESAATRVSPAILVAVRLLSPVVGAVRLFVRLVLHIFGVRADPDARIMNAREDIRGAITLHHSEGSVRKDDRDRLLGALELGDREVEEIMLHRSEIEMVDADARPEDIIAQCLNSPHSRLPVYQGEPENIVGVIHAKDLLRAVEDIIRGKTDGLRKINDLNIMDIAMPPYFVPDTTPLDEQMRQFLKRKSHFALVVDEYGVLQGLITLEDILEEIVGEIADEFDVASDEFKRMSDGSVVAEGSATIRDINRACEWDLPDDEANTIAGLIIHEAQTIPTVGQSFIFHGYRFEILGRERNKLTRLRVRKLA
ncbi:MAG: HlyC/CorC family transporter [Paracoccaceae bacterium]